MSSKSIDEYLDIEVVRFGPKLRVRKEIAPDTIDVVVPSMILQPLVENSIKHGLSRKVGAGTIVIRSWREQARVMIEVEDDGMGFLLERLDQPMASGIGLANVRERLRVIYGADLPAARSRASRARARRATHRDSRADGRRADHGMRGVSSSTTSSSRARSCAFSSGSSATRKSSRRRATGWRPSPPSNGTSPISSFSTSRCRD